MTTVAGPRAWSRAAASRAPRSSFTGIPERIPASCSLGVRMATRRRSPSSSGQAGAGLSTTGTPFFPAFRAAASTVPRGDSSWRRTMSAASNAPSALATSSTERSALAPDATEMLFSPRSSTLIRATPEPQLGLQGLGTGQDDVALGLGRRAVGHGEISSLGDVESQEAGFLGGPALEDAGDDPAGGRA